MRRIYIFDTTLRDGEQSPGASLNAQEKLEIAKQLARLQVDIIEAGFPISSPEDFDAVALIAQEVGTPEGPIICGLARVRPEDIERCWEAVKYAAKPRIHTFVATSDIHVKSKLRRSKEEVLQMAVEGVRLARSLCEDVEFSTEDAARSDLGYLCEVIAAAIEAGATTINIPDTVGYATPEHFASIVRYVRKHVPNIRRVRLSVHCHNDLGLAVANSLAAIKEGAEQVECTINGIGERAGNASLEEIVMALKVRRDYFQAYTEVNTREIYRTSQLVSRLTGLPVQPNKAIVGANAFAHSSGIHQDGVLKDPQTYEIMDPQEVGVPTRRLPLDRHSGRHALRARLEELGYDLDNERLNQVYERFLEVARKKKEVFDEDLIALAEESMAQVPEFYQLDFFHVTTGSQVPPTATVRLTSKGEAFQDAACGDGAVDALYKAIDRITRVEVQLLDYRVSGVTSGKDAMGEAVVKVQANGQIVTGRGSSTDVIEASAKAYLNAVNRVLWLRELEARRRAEGKEAIRLDEPVEVV